MGECDATRGYHVINSIAHVIALILSYYSLFTFEWEGGQRCQICRRYSISLRHDNYQRKTQKLVDDYLAGPFLEQRRSLNTHPLAPRAEYGTTRFPFIKHSLRTTTIVVFLSFPSSLLSLFDPNSPKRQTSEDLMAQISRCFS